MNRREGYYKVKKGNLTEWSYWDGKHHSWVFAGGREGCGDCYWDDIDETSYTPEAPHA